MASSVLSRRHPVKGRFMPVEELKQTQYILKTMQCNESRIAYERWIRQRKETIQTIGILEKKLENLHKVCSTANGIGNALEVVGCLSMVAGAALTAFGHKDVGEFLMKKVSNVSTVTGMATTVSSSIAESGLTIKSINEARVMLLKDQECTKSVEGIFLLSKDMDSRLKRIFNCSVLSNSFEHVVRFVQEGIVLSQVGSVEISKLKHVLIRRASKSTRYSELPEIVFQNVQTTIENILNNPEACKAVLNICKIIQESPCAFEAVKLGLKITFQICGILNVGAFTNLHFSYVMVSSAGMLATKSLMGTVLMATKVLGVISAVKEFKEGSSKYSKMLKDVKQALVSELDTVHENYPKLL